VSSVIYDISMSLDGYVRARDPRPDEPLGVGGEDLHGWALGADAAGRAYAERAIGSLGALICGRRTYDDSLRWWGADGPTGSARLPLVVLTHEAPAESPEGGVYTFATGGVDDALRQARALAGDRAISIMGGPDVATQFLEAGLVDEVSVHVVPFLFGAGTLLTGTLPAHVGLEAVEQLPTSHAVHLRYRVLRAA
jgi:dihydrofolate reductase